MYYKLLYNITFSFLLIVAFSLGACQGETASSSQKDKTDNAAAPKVAQQKNTQTTASKKSKTVLFFGDSLSAGYGIEKKQAFPALIQNKIDSLGMDYKVVNAGLSGETTAGGLRRVDWVLKQPIDVFILELGGNDGLRGVNTEETYRNLKGIIEKVKAKYPECTLVLAGMEAPPNMGNDFTSKFRDNFKRLAKEYDLPFIPFLLEKVAGQKALNLPDGIHPTAQGHKLVASTVWEYLQEVL